jgi:hypothetical protein
MINYFTQAKKEERKTKWFFTLFLCLLRSLL